MKKVILFYFVGISSFLYSQQFPCTTNSILYQVRGQGTNSQSFDQYLPNQSGYAPVNPSNPIISENVNAIGFNVLDGYIYGIKHGTRELVRLDASANITSIANVTSLQDSILYVTGDCDFNGNLYVTNGKIEEVYRINLQSNNSVTEIDFNQDIGCSDFCYNPQNQLFYGLTDNGVLREFNMNTATFHDNYGVPTASDGIVTSNCDSAFGAAFADINGSMYFFCNESGNLFQISISNNIAYSTRIDTTTQLGTNDGASCAKSSGFGNSFDPCCPPLTKESMADFFTPTFLTGGNSSYRMIFTEDQNFKNMMQAYIDLLNLTCGATELHFAWQLCEKGTGNQPANNYCNNPIEKEYFHFVAGGNSVIQNSGYTSSGFFNNFGAECQSNTWYSITVGMYPNNNLDCFDTEECSATTSFDFRWQLMKNMRGISEIEIKGIGNKEIIRKKKSAIIDMSKKRN